MSITPIEIATMAPKSQEVTPYKQQEYQKPLNDQLLIGQQLNHQIQKESQQTVRTFKSENQEYRYDAKEKGNNSYSYSYSGRKKDKKQKAKEAAPKNNCRYGSIDIKI
ncbi:MAG: DEAD/DEAH box helicase [Lachnoclostridium sp.]|jgi:hypothetical protein